MKNKEKVRIKQVAQATDQNGQLRTWTSQKNNTVYKIMNVWLDDGRMGQWLSDGKSELVAGQEVELEVEQTSFNGLPQTKFYYNTNAGGGGKGSGYRGKSPEERDEMARMNALNHATKLVCENPNVQVAVKGKERESIFIIADSFLQYIKTGQRPGAKPAAAQQQPPPQPPQPVQQPQNGMTHAQNLAHEANNSSHGLPF